MYAEWQYQNLDVKSSSAGSGRQANPPQQGRGNQGRGNQTQGNRGRGGRQQVQGRVNNITFQDAQANPDFIMGTLNVLGHFAKVLIDSGATHSVISHKFSQITQPHPILIDDVVMSANLVPLDIMPIQIVMEGCIDHACLLLRLLVNIVV